MQTLGIDRDRRPLSIAVLDNDTMHMGARQNSWHVTQQAYMLPPLYTSPISLSLSLSHRIVQRSNDIHRQDRSLLLRLRPRLHSARQRAQSLGRCCPPIRWTPFLATRGSCHALAPQRDMQRPLKTRVRLEGQSWRCLRRSNGGACDARESRIMIQSITRRRALRAPEVRSSGMSLVSAACSVGASKTVEADRGLGVEGVEVEVDGGTDIRRRRVQ